MVNEDYHLRNRFRAMTSVHSSTTWMSSYRPHMVLVRYTLIKLSSMQAIDLAAALLSPG